MAWQPAKLVLLKTRSLPGGAWPWRGNGHVGLGCWEGFRYHEQRLRRYINEGRYDGVFMLGVSMGGSGALLFSHLATAVFSFVPQVELSYDEKAGKIADEQRHAFRRLLVDNVHSALKNGTTFEVHRGSFHLDIAHLAELEKDLQEAGVSQAFSETDWKHDGNGQFRVKVYPSHHHNICLPLKAKYKVLDKGK